MAAQINVFAARAMLMLGHGVGVQDAIEWIIRRLHKNLRDFWRRILWLEIAEAMA